MFYSYFLSFLLILLVPVVMSFVVFHRANAIIDDDTRRANTALMLQTRSYVDMILADMDQLTYLVAYNTQLQTLLYQRRPVTNDDYYAAFLLARDFADVRDSSTSAIDFYVYFPGLDIVVSPDGYFTTRNFDISRRSTLQESHDEWLRNLHAIDRVTFRPDRVALRPHWHRTIVEPSIEYITPLPIGAPSAQPRAWAVVQIRQELLRRPVHGAAWSDESVFLVYHRAHGYLSSSDDDLSIDRLAAIDVNPSTLARNDEITLDGTTYAAFTEQSSLVNWRDAIYFTLLVPRALIGEEFALLRRLTVVAFVILTGVGLVLIYWLASARYKPIRSLLSTLQPEADGSFTLHSDEFQMIRASLEATLTEERLMRSELSESHQLFVQRYLRELLKGTIAWTSEAEGKLERHGVAFSHPLLSLAVVEPYLSDRHRYPRFVDRLEGLFDTVEEMEVTVVRDLDGAAGVLAAHPSEAHNDLMALLSRFKPIIEAETGIRCAIAVSATHARSDGLAVLLREAYTALSYRLVKGDAHPIHASEVLTSGRTYHYPLESEAKLINAISTGSYEEASRMLRSIFEANFSEGQLSAEMARCLMFDLISTMIKALSSIPSMDTDGGFWSEVQPVSRLTRCRSLEELGREMDDILGRVCRVVRAGRSSHAEHVRDQILSFVEGHLHDRNLGPDMVADHLNRSSAYLARFFREETGVGLSTHIKRLRVTEAKTLLRDETLTIRDVAEHVGFSDSNALIRAFKSMEGVTPGEYRESLSSPAIPAPIATDVRN
ncbi:MAG: helix-turn-helix transcriptional regulator [bacterium]